ncbi:FxSxx-COOH cyclophane-containing RiPP peptide [Dactylosporangium sp. NPDC051541]|uniref:FxSxx-COOH cyclophane-containing RiPP peptide n=1 Tax=Dactylosporangium sp. NPDC051541 TaxID=3363977 RepID=UPI00379AF061
MKAGLVGDGSKSDTPDRLHAAIADLSGNPDDPRHSGTITLIAQRNDSLVDAFRDPARLAALGDGVLAHTIRRVLGEVDEPHETVAGFNSSI